MKLDLPNKGTDDRLSEPRPPIRARPVASRMGHHYSLLCSRWAATSRYNSSPQRREVPDPLLLLLLHRETLKNCG